MIPILPKEHSDLKRNAGDNQRWMPQMAQAGLRYYRTAHTLWGALKRQPGQWD